MKKSEIKRVRLGENDHFFLSTAQRLLVYNTEGKILGTLSTHVEKHN